MSNMRDGPVLKAVADVVKQHVGAAFAGLRGRIDAIESQIKSQPKPEKGEKGDKGDTGIGEPGPIGPVGPAGKDGIGTVGESGPPGLVGKDGKDGAPGRDGIDGAPGNPGEKGIDGAAGRDGKDGAEGAKGNDGAAGKDGRDGIDGKDGAPGLDGKNGADGVNGKDGVPGIDGKNGADGIQGKDADVESLVAITFEKVKALIPDPIPGKDGKDGRDGLTGPTGPQGRQGSEGIAGKDAADLDPILGIDESLSYQKGTWAHHRSGIIRAVRTTDPIKDGDVEAAGWAVCMNSIHEIVEALAPDGRTVIKSHVMTSGKSIVTKYKSYQQINQGVYKVDREYERGDITTLAGSSWHANQTTKDRPGTSAAWTLVTKRGSDASSLNGARK